MKRVILDQGLPRKSSAMLRSEGWAAVHTAEIGMHESTDAQILEYASQESRTVVTLDRDFPQIMAMVGAHRPFGCSIRQQRLRASDVAALIKSNWVEHESDLETGCVVTASARGIRSTLWPLK